MVEKKIIVTMEDGSIFMMPDSTWVKAFRIKYGGKEKEALHLFKEAVAKHWKAHTVPTKFGFDEDWEEEYQDQASLGMDVMYVYIRTALLAVAMEEEALRGKAKTQPRVLGIGEDGITEYTGHGKRKIESEELSGRGNIPNTPPNAPARKRVRGKIVSRDSDRVLDMPKSEFANVQTFIESSLSSLWIDKREDVWNRYVTARKKSGRKPALRGRG